MVGPGPELIETSGDVGLRQLDRLQGVQEQGDAVVEAADELPDKAGEREL